MYVVWVYTIAFVKLVYIACVYTIVLTRLLYVVWVYIAIWIEKYVFSSVH